MQNASSKNNHPQKKIREPPKNHAPKNYPQMFNVLFSTVDGYQFTNMVKNKQTKIPKPSNFRAFNFETNPALVMAPWPVLRIGTFAENLAACGAPVSLTRFAIQNIMESMAISCTVPKLEVLLYHKAICIWGTSEPLDKPYICNYLQPRCPKWPLIKLLICRVLVLGFDQCSVNIGFWVPHCSQS